MLEYGDKVYKEKARRWYRVCWRWQDCNYKQSDRDSLTEMGTTEGGDKIYAHLTEKSSGRGNVKCEDSSAGAPGV